MIVCKFGGTSVADAEAMERLVAIVRDRLEEAPLVVVSAIAGASDTLIGLLDTAAAGKDEDSARALRRLGRSPRRVARRDRGGGRRGRGGARRAGRALRNARRSSSRRRLGRRRDPLGPRAFRGGGRAPLEPHRGRGLGGRGRRRDVDRRAHGRSNSGRRSGEGRPRARRHPRTGGRAWWRPISAPGRAVVTQGFIGGAVVDGVLRPTLLGRGGSDYSASLLGSALDAKRVEIWTDVDGVLTSSPKLVPNARRVKSLSFEEASELAYFGAKVLHPSTLLPAVEASIPVWVGNSRNRAGARGRRSSPGASSPTMAGSRSRRSPTSAGSRCCRWSRPACSWRTASSRASSRCSTRTAPPSISSRPPRSRCRSRSTTTAGSRRSSRRFRPSRGSRSSGGWRSFASWAKDCAGTRTSRPRSFERSDDVPVRMITHGSSAMNLSLVVREADVAEAVRSLHDAFFRGPLPAEIFAPPPSGRRRRPRPTPPVPRATLVALADASRDAAVRLRPGGDRRAPRDAPPAPAARSGPSAVCVQGERAPRAPVPSRRAAASGSRPHLRARRCVRFECGHAPERILVSATNAHATDLADLAAPRLPSRSGVPLRRAARGRARARYARAAPDESRGGGRSSPPRRHRRGGEQVRHPPRGSRRRASKRAARRRLPVLGLHAHMGSGILDPAPLLSSARALLRSGPTGRGAST